MKWDLEPIILDCNSDLDDIFELCYIYLKEISINPSEKIIEKYADELISNIQKGEDIYILLKNEQQESLWYVALDHINKQDSHRIYSLFVLPEYRQHWYATDLFSQLPTLINDSVYIDILGQENYSRQHINISVDRLKNLFIKSGYSIARNGHDIAYKINPTLL